LKRLLAAGAVAGILTGCGGGSTSPTPPDPLTQLAPLVARVREMADDNEVPLPGTPLEAQTHADGRAVANCVDFTLTFLQLLQEQVPHVRAREVAGCLATNTYDCHTVAEVYDGEAWRIVDPTFGWIPRNPDGSGATRNDLHRAARAHAWASIAYQYVTAKADFYGRRNYLDWPLYWVDTYDGEIDLDDDADDAVALEFYVPLGSLPPPGAKGVYALQCAAGATSAAALWDGVELSYPCNQGVTHVRAASSVIPQEGAVLLQPVRFVFPWDGTCNVVSACGEGSQLPTVRSPDT